MKRFTLFVVLPCPVLLAWSVDWFAQQAYSLASHFHNLGAPIQK